MTRRFLCELRTNNDEEATIRKVSLTLLPRIGEHLCTELEHDDRLHNFIVKDIWHWCGDSNTRHKIIIYVNYV